MIAAPSRRVTLVAILFLALAVAVALGPAAVRSLGGGEGARALRPGVPAPEITGGPWINSEPLTLAGLRGRVVLVEFWTYG